MPTVTYRLRAQTDDNQLFVAYGASYAEAYAAALAMEFSEAKPVPDDTTGDVSGLVSSIMHTPSGEPILLGTVMLEDESDAGENDQDAAQAENSANGKPVPMLTAGRKFVRYALLALGAVTFTLAGLYFAGYIP